MSQKWSASTDRNSLSGVMGCWVFFGPLENGSQEDDPFGLRRPHLMYQPRNSTVRPLGISCCYRSVLL